MSNVKGNSNIQAVPGVYGDNTAGGDGVYGTGRRGVVGESATFQGVYGHSTDNAGVVGESDHLHGIFGVCHNPHGAGVYGTNDQQGGFGVQGFNPVGDGVIGTGIRGVVGQSDTFQGVYGSSRDNAGVVGESAQFDGVFGVSHNPSAAGVSGHSVNPDGTPNQNGLAGFFDGTVTVTGNHQCNGNAQVNGNHTVLGDIFVPGADCAEHFDIAGLEEFEPGTVMVIDSHGALTQSSQAYDKRAAGVISGAGNFRPGIVLDKQQDSGNRLPIALVGKVYCKVDADISPIQVGDMLATSPTPGHAMKAEDPQRSFGAVIGKALKSLPSGKGLVPILVCLQ